MLQMKKSAMLDDVECLVKCIREDLNANDKKKMIDDIELAEWMLEQLKEKAKRYSY